MSRAIRRATLTACRVPVLMLLAACWMLDAFVEPLTWIRDAIGYALQGAVTGLARVDDALRRRIGSET